MLPNELIFAARITGVLNVKALRAVSNAAPGLLICSICCRRCSLGIVVYAELTPDLRLHWSVNAQCIMGLQEFPRLNPNLL